MEDQDKLVEAILTQTGLPPPPPLLLSSGKGLHQVLEVDVPARQEVDKLLQVFNPSQGAASNEPSPPTEPTDVCKVLQSVVATTCESIAALNHRGAATKTEQGEVSTSGGVGGGSADSRQYFLSHVLPIYLERKVRSKSKSQDLCHSKQLLCTPETVIDSWKCGSIGVSLQLLRQSQDCVVSLLERCLMDVLMDPMAEIRNGSGEKQIRRQNTTKSLQVRFKKSDGCSCLVSCCLRAPDLTAKIKQSLAHWIKELKSVELWDFYEHFSASILNSEDEDGKFTVQLQYHPCFGDFVRLRREFLLGKKQADRGNEGSLPLLKQALQSLQQILAHKGVQTKSDRTHDDSPIIPVLMESRAFLKFIMLYAYSSTYCDDEEEEEEEGIPLQDLRQTSEEALGYLRTWLGLDQSGTSLSQWCANALNKLATEKGDDTSNTLSRAFFFTIE